MSQHLGEWYQGRQYLPDYRDGLVPGLSAADAGLAVTKFGYFDFDVSSRPENPREFEAGSCAAAAIYNMYMIGAGGRTEGEARACAADSVPLLMRANSELRCEPDLSLWTDHPYAEDFKVVIERHMDPAVEPTRADGWWPRPDDEFIHGGVAYNIRQFLNRVGLPSPIQPGFPHTWDDECGSGSEGLFGCGPGGTEAERSGNADYRRSFGSRPLFRRFEVSISLPGETLGDEAERSIPEEWQAGFAGYLTPTLGDTPNESRLARTDILSPADGPAYGSREWLERHLTDSDGNLRFRGAALINVLEGAGDSETFPVADCLRLLPSDAPVLDREAEDASEFWNSAEWRECAEEAFDDRGGTGRMSSGMLALTTWLRFQGGPDVTASELVDRVEEVSGTNLDADGWATGLPTDRQFGMPEVPRANQRVLNSLLGLGDGTHKWYRSAGSQISCLWGGIVATDLAASASVMEANAKSEVERLLGELVDVQMAVEGELGEERRFKITNITYPPGETQNHQVTDLGCVDGYESSRETWEQKVITEKCNCFTEINGVTYQVDCPSSDLHDQSAQSTTEECWEETTWEDQENDETGDKCEAPSGEEQCACWQCSGDGTNVVELDQGGTELLCGDDAQVYSEVRVSCWTGPRPQAPCSGAIQVHGTDTRTAGQILGLGFAPSASSSPWGNLQNPRGNDLGTPGFRGLMNPAMAGGAPLSPWESARRAAERDRGVVDSVQGTAAFGQETAPAAPRTGAAVPGGSALTPQESIRRSALRDRETVSSQTALSGQPLSSDPEWAERYAAFLSGRDVQGVRDTAARYGSEQVAPGDLRSGVRAMRDGMALDSVVRVNRLQSNLADPAGASPENQYGASGDPYRRSPTDYVPPAYLSTGPGADLSAGPVRELSGGVWEASRRGVDAAAGGWYGWNVGGRPCPTGTACAQAMAQALTTSGSFVTPGTFNCASNIGYRGPFCLFKLIWKRNEVRAELERWAKTMQGWRAVAEYRTEVAASVAENSGAYADWSSFDGKLPSVSNANYVAASPGMVVLQNPACVLPPSGDPIPLHGIEDQIVVAYDSTNDADSPSLWDDTGVLRTSGTEPAGSRAWPPTEAMVEVETDSGETRSVLPGRYEGGESNLWRRVFYGDDSREPNWHPERAGRYGMATTRGLDESLLERLPPTMIRDDHLAGADLSTGGVVFRSLSCPDMDRPGNYASIRPVVCQDGRVWADFFLGDHQTPCVQGEADCRRRVYGEPVLATGGSGFDAQRSGGLAASEPLVQRFGHDYRHVCRFDGAGRITAIDDGRVSVAQGSSRSVEPANIFHWEAGPTDTDSGARGVWTQGVGRGDGLVHGHDPDEGYYPRAGWYVDQNGENIWFEPFSAYDNYAEVVTAGDTGRDGLLTRDTGLFVDHADESRVVYDSFVATPYEVRSRRADFALWDGVRRGDVNTEAPHLMWGWPTLDLQDDQTDNAQRFLAMQETKLTTFQQLFGVPPGEQEAEQIWVRNAGPMSFFGATRVGNGTGGSEKGGCLLEVNPPGFGLEYGDVMPFRPVLDNRLQAWCVMADDVAPADSCISLPGAPPVRIARPSYRPDTTTYDDTECDCWECVVDGEGAGMHVGTYAVDLACPQNHDPNVEIRRVCPSRYPAESPCAG